MFTAIIVLFDSEGKTKNSKMEAGFKSRCKTREMTPLVYIEVIIASLG